MMDIFCCLTTLVVMQLTTPLTGFKLKSESKLCCYPRSVGQCIMVSRPSWVKKPDLYYYQTVAGLLMLTLSLTRGLVCRLKFLLVLAKAVISGPSPMGFMTVFYSYYLRFETSQTWKARYMYLYPPETGWPSYNPKRWVPFSSPPTTRRRYRNQPPHGLLNGLLACKVLVI
jgi:hypothetical protein